MRLSQAGFDNRLESHLARPSNPRFETASQDVLAIELPHKIKAHLDLDAERSWVIVSECKVDVWPSPDLAQLPGRPGHYAYGLLPPAFYRQVRDAFIAVIGAKRVALVRRQ